MISANIFRRYDLFKSMVTLNQFLVQAPSCTFKSADVECVIKCIFVEQMSHCKLFRAR